MISSFLKFCQNVTIELNLFDFMIGLASLILITVIVVVVKMIVRSLKKEREVDERIRRARARIDRVIIEMEDCNELMSQTKPLNTKEQYDKVANAEQIVENSRQSNLESEVSIKEAKEVTVEEPKEVSNIPGGIPKSKKTRAMSMEERWAEFDKKRANKNTA